jgi:nucleoid DNA-binding protein
MDNKLNLQDFAQLFAERSHMDNKLAAAFVKNVFEIVEEYIAKDKIVKIKGLGTFKLITVSDRESINVNTGERIVIAGHSKLSFTPDSALKDSVNRPFGDFISTEIKEGTSIADMERLPEETVSSYEDETIVNETSNNADTVAVSAESAYSNPVDSSASTESSEISENTETENPAMEENIAKVEQAEKPEPTSYSTLHEENQSYPMSHEPIAEESCASCGRHRWLYAILTLALMVASYFAGLYQVHTMFAFKAETTSEPVNETEPAVTQATDKAVPAVAADSTSNDSVPATSETTAETTSATSAESAEQKPAHGGLQSAEPTSSSASQNTQQIPVSQSVTLSAAEIEQAIKNYPQVEGGEYWIVGDAGRIHYMEVGETLYRIAKKELGNRELVNYLIVFNNFKNPNLIHKGDPIRIPKLVKKQ